MKRSLESRLTSKGQVTVPLEIRQKLGITARDRVIFELDGNAVRLRAVISTSVRQGFGAVTARHTPEDFKQIDDLMEHEMSQEVLAETP